MVPAAIPVTRPVTSTVAVVVALLLQLPPGARSVSAVVAVTHTPGVPVIDPAETAAATVTTTVALAVPQLLITEYDITAVPAEAPVTMPVDPTVAIAGEPETQEPPPVASLRLRVAPVHTVGVPRIVPGLGKGLTVTIAVTEQPTPPVE